MRIGLISEMYGSILCPPKGYGGIARCIHNLTEEMHRQGHLVTLFAPPGSYCSGQTVECQPGDRDPGGGSYIPPYMDTLGGYLDKIDAWVDGTHHHWPSRIWLRERPQVIITAFSGNPNPSDLSQNPVIQSPHMVKGLNLLDYGDKIPCHFVGVDLDEFTPGYEPGDHLVSINGIAAHKGIHLAAEAAERAGWSLDLYGHVPLPFADYFDQKVRPIVERCSRVRYLGEIGEERIGIMQQAACSFTLSQWPEPGAGIVIESLACGCPTVTTTAGCFPYYFEGNNAGAMVEHPYTIDGVIAATQKVLAAGVAMRHEARRVAEKQFDLRDWAAWYVTVLERAQRERWYP